MRCTRPAAYVHREEEAVSEIPLMRAGLALMAFTALVAGVSLLVVPRDRDGNGPRTFAPDTAGPAAETAGAAPAAGPPRSFACGVDTAGVRLPNAVRESSGLALGAGGDALWTHNDSGEPVLHLVGLDGTQRARVRVTGASLADWEDLAAGPCPGGGRCLFVGDVGDNQATRPRITIYRVPEPTAGDAQTLPAEALVAEYPDGPHDAEGLFVLPDGGVYVVTKGSTGPIAIYRLPRTARPGTPARLEPVVRLRAATVPRRQRITGAAASPDGRWIALRTLDALFLYPAGDLAGGSLGEPLAYDLRPLDEPQGEAVAFGPGGAVHLSSEGGGGDDPAMLARLTCTLPG